VRPPPRLIDFETTAPAPGFDLGGQPQNPASLRIERASQTDLSVFFSQYEDSGSIPDDILERYLTNPEMMATQMALLSDLIDRLESGGAPLTAQGFYEMALAYTDDPGTALLLCHNVLKALARGRSPIPWEVVSREPLVYLFDGRRIEIDPSQLHPDARPTGARGQPSIFYRLFSADEFGQMDEGDWYHFFLEAAAAYYGATGRADPGGPGLGPDYYHVVGNAVDDTMRQMQDPSLEDSDAYRGWRWANALSYLEEAYYGTDYQGTQAEASREARDHRRGAIFGLQLAGVEPEWPWYVPRIGTAGLTGVDVPSTIYEIVPPDSEP